MEIWKEFEFLSEFFIVPLPLKFKHLFYTRSASSLPLTLTVFTLCLCSYLLLWTLASSPVEAMPASRGGRIGGGIAVFLVAAIRAHRTRKAAGFVVGVKVGRAAGSAASSTVASAPHVNLCHQYELPVCSFQIKIVHPEHGVSLLGRQSQTHCDLRRYPNM